MEITKRINDYFLSASHKLGKLIISIHDAEFNYESSYDRQMSFNIYSHYAYTYSINLTPCQLYHIIRNAIGNNGVFIPTASPDMMKVRFDFEHLGLDSRIELTIPNKPNGLKIENVKLKSQLSEAQKEIKTLTNELTNIKEKINKLIDYTEFHDLPELIPV